MRPTAPRTIWTTSSWARAPRVRFGPVPAVCRRVLRAAALASLAASFGSAALAAASSSASGGAQLTGSYRVSFHVVSPAADRRDRTTLTLGFTGECASGGCEATVSTLANSCPSGSCAQPPSDLSFADELLRLSGGEYRGTFTIKTGCTAQGTYFPYAYDQRTLLAIRPTSTRDVDGLLQATRFVGTLELVGSANAIGRKWGCPAYRFGLDLAGTSET